MEIDKKIVFENILKYYLTFANSNIVYTTSFDRYPKALKHKLLSISMFLFRVSK